MSSRILGVVLVFTDNQHFTSNQMDYFIVPGKLLTKASFVVQI